MLVPDGVDADALRATILDRFDMSLGHRARQGEGPRVPHRPPRLVQRSDARRHAVRRADGTRRWPESRTATASRRRWRTWRRRRRRRSSQRSDAAAVQRHRARARSRAAHRGAAARGGRRRRAVRPRRARHVRAPTRRSTRSCRSASWSRARRRTSKRRSRSRASRGVPVTARGGGTSQCGQTVNHGLIVDVQPAPARARRLDTAARRGARAAGHRARRSQSRLKPHGLFFPVDPSTASRATIGGMTANNSSGARSIRYGIMADNVAGIDAVLADGTRAYFGEVRRRRERRGERALSRARRARARDRRARSCRDRGAHPQGAAARRRLRDPARPARRRLQHGQAPRRLRRNARVLRPRSTSRCSRCRARRRSASATSRPSPTRCARREALVALDPVAVELVDRTMIELSREIAAFAPIMAQVRARRTGLAAARRVHRRRARAARAQARRARRDDGGARLSARRGEADRRRAAGRDVGSARGGSRTS